MSPHTSFRAPTFAPIVKKRLLSFVGCLIALPISMSSCKKETVEKPADREQKAATETLANTSPPPVQPLPQTPPNPTPQKASNPEIPVGKIGLTILANEPHETPGLVRFKLGNGLDEKIESARAWVILLDNGGKIIGQKAFWLSQKNNSVLEQQQEREWTTVVEVNGIPTSVKFTFSSINGSSGKTIDPESVLVRKQAIR
jgi:hypothetical protein